MDLRSLEIFPLNIHERCRAEREREKGCEAKKEKQRKIEREREKRESSSEGRDGEDAIDSSERERGRLSV